MLVFDYGTAVLCSLLLYSLDPLDPRRKDANPSMYLLREPIDVSPEKNDSAHTLMCLPPPFLYCVTAFSTSPEDYF